METQPAQSPQKLQSIEQPVQKPIKPVQPSKAPLIIMAVIASLSIITTVYFVYQNYQLKRQISQIEPAPNSTASPSSITDGWKTYSSNSISFKYPHSLYTFFLGSSGADVITEIHEYPQDDSRNGELWFNVPIYRLKTLSSITSEQRIDSLKNSLGINNFEEKTILIDSVGTKIFSGEITDGPGTGNIWREAHIENDGSLIVFIEEKPYKEPDLFNQILSTFKFSK
jgi:hypothetical protein